MAASAICPADRAAGRLELDVGPALFDIGNEETTSMQTRNENRSGGFAPGSRARDVMTPDVRVVAPEDSIQRAAEIMRDVDVGSVPVCDGQRLQGMVTDRDLAVRAVAMALPADRTRVSEIMTGEVFWCFDDDDIHEVLAKMGDRQVRRIPVVDRDKKLVGIVSLGDVATETNTHVDDALEEISQPPQS